MSKKRPRLWYAQFRIGMLYLWAWVFAYYSGQAIPEPQLSNKVNTRAFCRSYLSWIESVSLGYIKHTLL
jgi:hypothetical protein